MNRVSAPLVWEPTSRVKAAIAVLLTFFLVLAGALTPPPALALDGAVISGEVTPSTSGISVSVSGTGFGDVTAAYVAVIEKGAEAALGQSDPSIEAHLAAGAFAGSLDRAASALDRTKQYEVIAWQTRSFPSASTIYARADLSITSGQWDVVFPPAPEPEPEVPATPVAVLSVSKTSGLDPAGASLTVTGSGYEINDGGIYAQIGWIVEGAWTPISQTETRAANRANAASSWIGSGIPGQPAWTVAPDGSGSFSWTTTVTKAALDAKRLEGATLAVFTLGAHSNWVQPANERFTTISFADPTPEPEPEPEPEPAPVPTITASPIENLDHTVENVVTVTGTGFVNRVWVAIAPTAFWDGTQPRPLEGWTTVTAGFPRGEDGSFTATLTIPPGTLDPGTTYAISTAMMVGEPLPSHQTFTPVTVAVPVAAVDVDLSASSVVSGESLTVSGSGFDENAPATTGTRLPLLGKFGGAYVQFGYYVGSTWTALGRGVDYTKWAVDAADGESIGGTTAGAIALGDGGTFTTTVKVEKSASAPAGARYGVRTFAGGGATYSSFSTFAEVAVLDRPTVVVGTTSGVVEGQQLAISGSAFLENAPATNGTRAPLPGRFGGAYVQFGYYVGSTWTAIGRGAEYTKWAVNAEDVESIGGAAAGAIALGAGGTFATTVKAAKASAAPEGARYGIRTFAGSGSTHAPFSTFTEVSFATAPAVVVSQTDDVVHGTVLTGIGANYVAKAPATDGTRAPLAGKFGGAYVQFGYYVGSTWTAIGRGADYAKWAVNAEDVESIGGAAAGAIALGENGTFTTTLTAAQASAAPEGARYGVRTFAGSGSTYAAFSTFTEIEFHADDVAALAVSVPAVTADAATVRVVGSGFGDTVGAYAAVIEKGTESGLSASGGYVAFGYWMTPGAIVDGAFDKTLSAPVDKLDRAKSYEVLVWKGHSAPDASTIYARADVAISADQWNILDPEVVPPVDPTTPTAPPVVVAGGALKWAISSSFTSYVTGPIAHGSIAVSGGATRAGGLFQFGQATGSTYDAATGTGAVSYVGSVRFTGHSGILDVTVANPQIRVTSATAATLYVTSGGSQVAFATLDVAAAAKSTAAGAVTYANVPATLTQAGISQVFGGNATTLDPLTFTVGTAAPAPTGSTGTVASAPAAAPAATLPATPPTSAGIELDAATLAALQAGERATVSASGFTANESGIQVVVYSTPVLLDTVSADASGTATWTGTLPATLADGEHTLTFQGSVDRGIVFTLNRAAATTALGSCVVESATLNWGFKESFRTYIEGIAAGGWTLTDVAYEYPEYVWTGGAGRVDVETLTGLVTYGGSIAFTGHSGALDTTLSNFRVELAGDVGYIVVDVQGTTQGGDAVIQSGIRFAEFALPDLEVTADGLVLDALPATLTEAGAAAFGTYAAGEELDPVSALLPIDAACGEPVAAPADETPVAEGETTAIEPISSGTDAWPWALGGLAVLAAVGAVVWVVVARRRSATAGATEDDKS